MIFIVDYGMSNLGSIMNMLKRVGIKAIVSSDPDTILQATKLILPGVGAFDAGMQRLADYGLIDALNEKVLHQHTPILGLCLGMQLMMNGSEEGKLPGLGWIDGETIRFRFDNNPANLKIPHMGWNTVRPCKDGILLQMEMPTPRFYFVHSYHVVASNPGDVAGVTNHGYEFASVIERGNIRGTQFHPEKSHRFGMKLLKDFAERA